MGVVYSLYDALVSIHVPDEKAKAVIDALEREMMDKLATKADLAHLRDMISRDLDAIRVDMDHRFESLDHRFENLDHRFESVDHRFEGFDYKLEKLESRLTIRLGMMMAGSLVLTCTVLGTLLAALR